MKSKTIFERTRLDKTGLKHRFFINTLKKQPVWIWVKSNTSIYNGIYIIYLQHAPSVKKRKSTIQKGWVCKYIQINIYIEREPLLMKYRGSKYDCNIFNQWCWKMLQTYSEPIYCLLGLRPFCALLSTWKSNVKVSTDDKGWSSFGPPCEISNRTDVYIWQRNGVENAIILSRMSHYSKSFQSTLVANYQTTVKTP